MKLKTFRKTEVINKEYLYKKVDDVFGHISLTGKVDSEESFED